MAEQAIIHEQSAPERDPWSIEKVKQALDSTIVDDDATKLLTFYGCILLS